MTRTAAVAATLLASTSAYAQIDVVTSIKPIHSLVASVMQGVGEPELILKAAGSPHAQSLKPSQAAVIQGAEVIFWVGPELETFLAKPLQTVGADARVVELMQAPGLQVLNLREDENFEAHDHSAHGGEHEEHADHESHDHDEHHDHEAHHGHEHEGHEHHDDHDEEHHAHTHDDDHGHHKHEGVDGHIWLDPQNAAAIVKTVAKTLSEEDPQNAETYSKNAEATLERLSKLEASIDAELAPFEAKPYFVFHDGYQYFENRFDVPASGAITLNPEVQPGAKRIAAIQKKLKESGASCIFAEPQFQSRYIDLVASGTDTKIGIIDPIGAELEEGPALYEQLLQNMATSFSQCLK
ncbi:zinc ABC transporter substrate-binding protein [Rhodobacteraceae bacterium RKSG542]|nr:zinc ABC transporter substrate-binding protein [Pseudovibrio flavus]MTI16017.1 zinc ABC transporter substrate-binding protein [Pseudovibrio flavus]